MLKSFLLIISQHFNTSWRNLKALLGSYSICDD